MLCSATADLSGWARRTSVDNHFTRQYNPEDSSEHQFVYSSTVEGCLPIAAKQF
jgi:outer membrane protease